MTPFGDTGRRRLALIGLLAAPLALAGWVGAGIAQGASVPAPSMEVLPRADLAYGQTVEIRAHHLPRGSGSVATTICGLQDAGGSPIARPRADDCASASAGGDLAVVEPRRPDGELDVKYSLPASTQTFGSNHRFCDHTHRCAVFVSDANPTAPVYRLETVIFFADQGDVPTPAPTTATVAGGHDAKGSELAAAAPRVTADAAPDATTHTAATTDTATTTSVDSRVSGAQASAASAGTPARSTRRDRSTASVASGPGSSTNENGAGSRGGTTSGIVSGSGSGPGSGGVSGSGSGSGPSAGPGRGDLTGGTTPTTAPPPVTVTLPPITLPPVTAAPPPPPPPTTTTTTTAPPTSDPVCADLADVVQLVAGDPSQLLADCGVTAPATPTAPLTGIVGPLLGRH